MGLSFVDVKSRKLKTVKFNILLYFLKQGVLIVCFCSCPRKFWKCTFKKNWVEVLKECYMIDWLINDAAALFFMKWENINPFDFATNFIWKDFGVLKINLWFCVTVSWIWKPVLEWHWWIVWTFTLWIEGAGFERRLWPMLIKLLII